MKTTLTTAGPFFFGGFQPGDYIAVGNEIRVVKRVVNSTCIEIAKLNAWHRFRNWWLSVALPTIHSWNPCNDEETIYG
jgi:hypothetical protein